MYNQQYQTYITNYNTHHSISIETVLHKIGSKSKSELLAVAQVAHNKSPDGDSARESETGSKSVVNGDDHRKPSTPRTVARNPADDCRHPKRRTVERILRCGSGETELNKRPRRSVGRWGECASCFNSHYIRYRASLVACLSAAVERASFRAWYGR